MEQEPRLRSPLGQAIGLGSAKEGVQHWWRQRLSAVALVPLALWFAASVIQHIGSSQEQVLGWMSAPVPAILMILVVGTAFYHTALGVQVVIEDYVHNEAAKIAALVVVRLGCLLFAVVGIFAVLRIAIGG